MSAVANPIQTRSQTGREIYGTFVLAGDEYAISMEDLREVVDFPAKLQRMPLAPDFLLGLADLRGRLLPVVDLRVLLKAPPRTGASEPRRMVVLRRGAACIGVVFDAVGEVLRIAPSELNPVDYPAGSGIPVRAVICRDEGERVIQVLDLAALLQIKNLPSIERAGEREEADSRLTHRMRDLYREKLVGFVVGTCSMALEMKCVVAIMEAAAQKPSPRKSSLCESIVHIHGHVVPVVKMAQVLSLESANENCRVLVCRVGDQWVGFEVDDVTSIIPYSRDRIMPVPVLNEHKAHVFHGCFTSREGQDFIVLDEAGILSRPEIAEISLGHERLVNKQKESADAGKASPRTSILAFRLGKLFGLRLLDVLEVLDWRDELARTPDTPPAVLGILNLRGTPIPVLDPRSLFRIAPATAATSPKILVFQDVGRKIGLRVDSVESIMQVSTGQEQDLPELFFRSYKGQFEDSFEKGISVPNEAGESVAVVMLQSRQIVERLAQALAPQPAGVA